MILILIFICIVCAILCYVFFAPFYLEIDSTEGVFRVRFHTIASVDLKIVDYSLILHIKVIGWTKEIDLLKVKRTSKDKKTKEKKVGKKKEQKKSLMKVTPKKIIAVLKSFKINKCEVFIDTGDVQLNGILYPIFYMAGYYSKKNIHINFINENVVRLEIENSVARMSRAYLNS